MKKILLAATAATALVGFAAPAAAQTNERHYAGTGSVSIPVLGSVPINYEITNPTAVNIPFLGPVNVGEALGELGVGLQLGTRYTATAGAPGDSETARDNIDVVFTLSGTVNADCSFYAGNTSSARNIDFGVIGIKTGDNENVNQAFEMVGPARADIETLTAGCNTNNQVEISKNDIRGLVNNNPGGYDTNEFQANIPYEVSASWTGVAYNTQGAGTGQSLTVGLNANAGQKQQGAWRSDMTIVIEAPAVTSHGLVSGTYTGETTVTLRAI